jgi:hypothetical protein
MADIDKSLAPMQYEVIDNYLPQEEFEKIRDVMMGPDFPWFYNPTVVYGSKDLNRTMYFTHNFYKNYLVNSNFYDLLLPLISKINAKALIRVKGNMYTNIGEKLREESHIDSSFEHKGAIFYINTNNAPTVLEEGIEIESVANRILFFKPHKMHNSTYCTDQKVRVNININYF